MKKVTIFLVLIFLFALGSSYKLSAQEKKAEKENEREIERVIVKQKKAMNKQQEAIERTQEIDEEQIEEDMERLEEELEESGIKNFQFHNGRRSFSFDVPDAPMPPNPPDPMFFRYSFGDEERTSWNFSKSIKEDSFSQDYSFEVEKTAKSVIMSVNGDCKAGEIRISIEMPNGKSYSDIVLDEFGNLNWRKSFNISETENQDKTGKWQFKINSKNATGYFKISFQTY